MRYASHLHIDVSILLVYWQHERVTIGLCRCVSKCLCVNRSLEILLHPLDVWHLVNGYVCVCRYGYGCCFSEKGGHLQTHFQTINLQINFVSSPLGLEVPIRYSQTVENRV